MSQLSGRLLATTLVEKQEAETEPVEQFAAQINSPSVEDSPVTVDESLNVSYTTVVTEATTAPENEDYWADISQFTQVELLSTDLSQDDDTLSPSPVVYPQRPPKGRKSLASVELPNFRQKST